MLSVLKRQTLTHEVYRILERNGGCLWEALLGDDS